MNFLTINDVKLPMPSSFQCTYSDFDSSEAGRNSRGELFRDRVCVKTKLEVGWNVLNAEEMSLILNAIEDVFFEVTYWDAKTMDYRTMTAYTGDRVNAMYTFNSNIGILYTDFKISIIER